MSNFQKVLDSVELPDELKQQIKEAWEAEVQANYEKVQAEHEHKLTESVGTEINDMVAAADALITSTLKKEISEMAEQRKEMRGIMDKERAKAVQQRIRESKEAKRNAELLENLVTQVLDSEIRELISERKDFKVEQDKRLNEMDQLIKESVQVEIKELKADREVIKESMSKMDDLVIGQLTRELSEFQADRRQLKEEKRKLKQDHERKLEEAKNAFMERAGKSVSTMIDNTLRKQLTELKEDIQIAKHNTFGRKIFEAFAAEYLTSHLSEGTELHKLRTKIEESNKNIAKMQQIIKEKEDKLNSSKAALRESREMNKRSEKMNSLLRPLNTTQRETMKALLEGVATDKLEESFKRYVPTILENSTRKKERKSLNEQSSKEEKPVLSESTGDRSKMNYQPTTVDPQNQEEDYSEIFRLAGVKR